MNIKEIKQIKLQDFLTAMGCKPVKQYGVNLMYLSPLRTEKHASFKVNTEINQWYDFGIGRGGNIITLAELLYNSSDVSYLIHQIERNAPSSVSGSLPTVKPTTPQNSFEHLQVLPITHPALIKYLEERCIDIETARTVCKELHFDTRGKHYFGIGFPNIAGGYEIRNPFFKGCIAPKDISHFYAEEPKKVCFLFEGLPSHFEVGRYHSWAVARPLPDDLIVTSVDEEGLVMSLRHKNYDVRGVQYHPESVLTSLGKQILSNWVNGI